MRAPKLCRSRRGGVAECKHIKEKFRAPPGGKADRDAVGSVS